MSVTDTDTRARTYVPPLLLGSLVLLTGAIAVTGVLLATFAIPDPGIRLTVTDGNAVVTTISQASEASGISPGDVVVALEAEGERLSIGPAQLATSVTTRREHFDGIESARQTYDDMHRVLDADQVVAITDEGKQHTIAISNGREASDAGWQYFLRLGCGLIAWLLGATLWIWRPGVRLHQVTMALGAGLMLLWVPSAPLLGALDMFYLPVAWHESLSTLQAVGALLTATAFLLLIFYYPSPLPNADRISATVVAAFAVYLGYLWMAGDLEGEGLWLRLEARYIYNVAPLLFIPLLYFGTRQWLRSRHDPVERAQVQWFVFSVMIGPTIWALFYWMPIMVGEAPYLPVSLAPVPIVISFALAVAGIWRHPAFQFESYVVAIYRWWLLTLAIGTVDIMLIGFGILGAENALVITLLFVLWVYLPLRMWIGNRLAHNEDQAQRVRNYRGILQMVDAASAENDSTESWESILRVVFNPVEVQRVPCEEPPQVLDRGRTLSIPATNYSPGYQLHSKQQGKSLFDDQDARIAILLLDVFERLFRNRDAFQAGKAEERQRISRDLHDQIGSNLLSMVYSADDDRTRALASDTLDQVRDMLRALKRAPIPLVSLEAKLHQLAEDVAGQHGLLLHWGKSMDDSQVTVTSTSYLSLVNIMRELLNNTIRHAGASGVWVEIEFASERFRLAYADDGAGFDPQTVSPGNGLRNIQSRVDELTGELRFRQMPNITTTIEIPAASMLARTEEELM